MKAITNVDEKLNPNSIDLLHKKGEFSDYSGDYDLTKLNDRIKYYKKHPSRRLYSYRFNKDEE
jgi:hypothetical protein